ncbi:MAG: RNA polymerase sigma factor SigF [Carbonactinosporaceae bacterium]
MTTIHVQDTVHGGAGLAEPSRSPAKEGGGVRTRGTIEPPKPPPRRYGGEGDRRVAGRAAHPDRQAAKQMFSELATLARGNPDHRELRNRIVEMHMHLSRQLAMHFRDRGEPLDDLIQVATVGLIKSVDRFDPCRGVEFSTFAVPTILGELKRHFRDTRWSVRVPRRLQEMHLALSAATNELAQRHGRSPTVAELAEHVGASLDEVFEGLEAAHAYSALSLDLPTQDDEESPTFADSIGQEDRTLENVEHEESLKPLLEELPAREKRILLLRFFGNRTQTQIAEQVGISQMHVSRLLARTLAQLRHGLLYADEPDDL